MKEAEAIQRATIEIHDISSSGDGVGRAADGRTLFVPLTAPGDRVGVRVVRKRKRHGHAVLEAIEEAAPSRVTPQCPLFGECGGCDWQHLAYEEQLRWKAHIVQQALRRVGKLECPLPTAYGAPHPYGTRSRARMPISPDQRPAFFQRASHNMVEVRHCPVLTAPLNRLLEAVFLALPSLPLTLDHIRLLASDEECALSLHVHPKAKLPPPAHNEKITAWCAALAGQLQKDASREDTAFVLSGVSWWRGRSALGSWGEATVTTGVEVPGQRVPIAYRPDGFAQASFQCNQTLVSRVLALLGDLAGEALVELYAGRGNLSLPIAAQGASVFALDADPQALEDGRAAARRASLQERVTFCRFNDARDDLAALCQEHGWPTPRRLLLDPPRQGLDPAMCRQIIAMNPEEILYVSCDPATLARDLRKLCDAGFLLQAVEVVDLIPQTAHIESLALLQRPST